MSKRIDLETFQSIGFIQETDSKEVMQCMFDVTVCNENNVCIVGFTPSKEEGIPYKYCVDFTEVLKTLEGENG